MSTTTFYSATGKVPYQLTNDYLFQAVLQSSNKTLKGLVCSLLHMNPKKIHSVVITNPIELGKKIDQKKFILDVRVVLDNQLSLNIELQVVNQGNWPERSIVYLCRSFDQLNKGQDYIEVMPIVQVCILDFTLFCDDPEFYATDKVGNGRRPAVPNPEMGQVIQGHHMGGDQDVGEKGRGNRERCAGCI